MRLVLRDEEVMLAEAASALVARTGDISRLRELRDAGDARGYSPKVHQEMSRAGWLGMALSTEDGGFGLGLGALTVVAEAVGRQLWPEPLLSAALAADLLAGQPKESARLAALIAGESVVAVAHAERKSRHRRFWVETTAQKTDDGWCLRGAKHQVLDGFLADAFVVSARISGDPGEPAGIGLFVVDGEASGLATERQWRVDDRNAAIVTLTDVQLPFEACLGEDVAEVLDVALDRATVALSAEMLGSMQQAFDITLAYIKERRQFGLPVGAFQALQHRAARAYIALEVARAGVLAAARAADEPRAHDQLPRLASLAKAQCNDAFILIANEAIQMHGGVGMTDEFDIGFYLKRARAAEMTHGDSAWHRDRYATLEGF